jgi:hypothetical protein
VARFSPCILGGLSWALFASQEFHASWREYCDLPIVSFPQFLSQGIPAMSSTKWNKAGLITNFDRILGVFSRALLRYKHFTQVGENIAILQLSVLPILSQGHPSYVSTMQMEQAGLIT